MPISEALLKEIREDAFLEEEVVISDEGIDDEEIQKLTDALRTNTKIKKISLIETDMTDRGAEVLSSVENLEEINICDARLTQHGISALLTAKVKTLRLRASSVRDTGLEEIEKNETLEYLDLGSNFITSKGAALIAKSKTIKVLDFTGNLLNDDCAIHFRNMPSLKELILRSNRITRIGADILDNSHIGEVDLFQNPIMREGPDNPFLLAYGLGAKRPLPLNANEAQSQETEKRLSYSPKE